MGDTLQEPGEHDGVEGHAARTAELVVRAGALAERMRARADSPTLPAHLATLDDAVSRGQSHLRRLAADRTGTDTDTDTDTDAGTDGRSGRVDPPHPRPQEHPT